MKYEAKTKRKMPTNRIYILITALLALQFLTVNDIFGQDIYFLQRDFTPLYINPALPATSYDASFSYLYRDQQINSSLSFKNHAFSGILPIYDKKHNRRKWGLGVAFYNDKSDDLASFTRTQLDLSVSYLLRLDRNQYLSFGFQGGFNRNSISESFASTGSQWVPNVGYDPSAPLNENMSTFNSTYGSFNSGLSYRKEDREGNTLFYGSISGFQLNQPVEGNFEGAQSIQAMWSLQAGGKIWEHDSWKALIDGLYQNRAGLDRYAFTGTLRYQLINYNPYSALKDGYLDLKVQYVSQQAIGFSVVFSQPNFELGIGYEVPVGNPMTEFHLNNAFEMGFTIKKRLVTKKKTKIVTNYNIKQVRDFYTGQRREFDFDRTPTTNQKSTEVLAADPVLSEDEEAEKKNIRFELKKNFNFEFNKADLDKEAREFLNQLVIMMKENEDLRLIVVGHTDNIGTNAANIELSQRRSDAVTNYMGTKGIDQDRMSSIGRGAKEPLVENKTEENRALNRRVEFIIYTE